MALLELRKGMDIMALPIIAVLAAGAKAVGSGVVKGTIKAALKRAATVAAEEVATTAIKSGAKAAVKQATSKEFLTQIAKKQFTDAQAVLMNRLKVSPTKALYDYVARDLGTDVENVKAIVKKFNQTPKMKEIAKGQPFKREAVKALKGQLNLPKKPRIVDIIRHARERAAKEWRKDEKSYKKHWNSLIRAKLEEINNRLREKIHGVSNAEDEFKTAQKFNIKVGKNFRATAEYDDSTLNALDDVLDALEDDIETYIPGSMESLVLIEYAPHKWSVHSRKAIQAYIDNIKGDVDAVISAKK